MNTGNNAATTATREIVITRIFDAPKDLVWRGWTEPERFKRWWGPKDFTAPICEINLRVGGKYFNCMRSPEGKNYYTTGVYLEIVPNERLVYTDSFADENGNAVSPAEYGMEGDWEEELIVTVMLEEHEGGTRMTLHHTGIPAGELADMTQSGWNESFDKLAASL